ncbi:MAG: hypothetical protein QNK28_10325 [Desulfobacterales bacterium]|nr:hypothetical protein [Desulfobacterales bacterium]
MQKLRHFNREELIKVDEAVKVSEELINNYFKMSSGQWLKNRYDIKTAKDLAFHEVVDGPFAQVIKYEGRRKDVPLGSSSFSLYKVCLQDCAILLTVEKRALLLEPFLLYILTHELAHIVRFSKFEQRYEDKNEADVTMEEERKVHQITYAVLKLVSVFGLKQVFEFYKDWLPVPGS